MSPRLDIDALKTLCAIADHGGITRASDHLALSQSAVSHKIKRLEQNIDCTLLTRRAGAPLLSSEGLRLLGYARRILALHDEALLSFSKKPLTGKIRLGMTEDVTSSDLSRILGRYTRLHPNVAVRSRVRQSLILQEELRQGEIDLAIMQVFSHQLKPQDVVLFEDKMHWVKATDVVISDKKPIPFLAYDAQCFYRQWVMDSERMFYPGVEEVLECASSAGIASAVKSGLGVALLPGRYLSKEMQIMESPFPPAPDITYIVRVAQQSRSKPVTALAREIVENVSFYPTLQVA
ncbi:LysR family transcriptional regulator [Roseovarius sp. EL26]|uniref:LysR family transcriptional regulator n=1 Tax=Roseovarius sp. EL26 TaxID=2126672 RepID=UPI000EA39263|nr:LysR family transcriptional regulator [Roseovarius sp. EL26]